MKEGAVIILIAVAAAINWFWPFFFWIGGDTPVYRFIWLGIFFVLLDILFETFSRAITEASLVAETLGFSRELHKIAEGFYVISKVSLPNGLKADHVVVGSSGVWLLAVKDDDGKITFDGDEIVQNGVIIRKLLPKTLEKSYFLAEFLKANLNRDFKVSPVLVFSSPKADLSAVPKMVRSVYVVSRKDAIPLIENTDVQIIDKNSIDEIHELLKNPTKNNKQ